MYVNVWWYGGLQKELFHYLAVVEVMFHTFDFLIVLMSLAGDKDYIARLCYGCRRAYRFPAVGNASGSLRPSMSSPSLHVADYVGGFLVARVV